MDSDLADALKLALEAMLLVESGSSERGAVLQAVAKDPGLAMVRRKGLKLATEVLNQQDFLDRIINAILLDGRAGKKTRSLLRLTTHLLLRSKNVESLERIERDICDLASAHDFGLIELLIGTVPSINLDSLKSDRGDSEKLAIENHYPQWWVQYCIRVFGRGEAVKLLSAKPRPKYVRVNSLRNRGRTTIPPKLKRLSSVVSKVATSAPVYYLNSPPSQLSAFFSEGLLQLQDLASFLAVEAADPRPGERVLDLCAAPGGKTATLAQFMKNRGMIISVDYSQARMRTWKQEISRLGVKIAQPIICAAQDLSLREEFDLVLIDPPCTGTGIFDRNPSMKWRLTPELLNRYCNLQSRFLESAATVVARGGRILYCTCSMTLEENERIVRSFLKSHPEFETRPVLTEHGTPGLEGFSDCRRLWPHRDKTAGYFVARLQWAN